MELKHNTVGVYREGKETRQEQQEQVISRSKFEQGGTDKGFEAAAMVGLSHFGSGQAYYRTHDVSSGGGPLFSSRA